MSRNIRRRRRHVTGSMCFMQREAIAGEGAPHDDEPQHNESETVHPTGQLYAGNSRKYSPFQQIALPYRFLVWFLAAVGTLAADSPTMAAPHAVILHNARPPPWPLLLLAAVALLVLGLWGSPLLAFGAGLM